MIPLGDRAPAGSRIQGRVIAEGSRAQGIALALVDAKSREPVRQTVTAEDGAFEFAELPPGIYRLRITLPPGFRLADEMDGGQWVAPDGSVDIEVGADDNNREGLEIQVCHS